MYLILNYLISYFVFIVNLTAMGGNSNILSHFAIGVGNIDSMNTCATVYDALPMGGNQTFTCSPQPVIGMNRRYVSVMKFGGGCPAGQIPSYCIADLRLNSTTCFQIYLHHAIQLIMAEFRHVDHA